MKIGILTHHYVSNYGAFLQTYALQNILSTEFSEDTVEVINYVNLKHIVINTCGWFRFYKEKESFKDWIQKIRVPFTFSRERKKHLKLSKRCFTVNQVNKLKYDTIIVGSDEVWNYQDKKSSAKIKFAHNVKCAKIISYAPSVGNSSGNVPEYIREGLKKFSSISVRDEMTYDFVKNEIDQKATIVLDPTFLSMFPERKISGIKKPYILFYYCDRLPAKIKKQIYDYAKTNGYYIYGAGECDRNYDKTTVDLTPFEWVNLFKEADMVFTGTFHGVVFSLLYKHPFRVFVTNKSRIRKVRSLMKMLEVENREIEDNYIFNIKQEKTALDYEKISDITDRKKVESLFFLHNAIEKEK